MAKRILIVDDEDDLVHSLCIYLEREGYHVTTASDGQEALDCLTAQSPVQNLTLLDPAEEEPNPKLAPSPLPDLIVLDIEMPHLNGLETLKCLRANPTTARIPVIFLTARDGFLDIEEGWAIGADLYLTKPFDPEQLHDFLRLIFDE